MSDSIELRRVLADELFALAMKFRAESIRAISSEIKHHTEDVLLVDRIVRRHTGRHTISVTYEEKP
jgi:hypothetical protein